MKLVVKPSAHSQDSFGQTAHGLTQMNLENLQEDQDCSFCEQPHLKLDCSHDRKSEPLWFLPVHSFSTSSLYTSVKISPCRNCPCCLPPPVVFVLNSPSSLTSPHRAGESNPAISVTLHCLFFFCIERENDVLFSIIIS